jgi:crotonobetainyl-CoA:carnitine CoA-transferase CaiB-like acyl-CoA transferase
VEGTQVIGPLEGVRIIDLTRFPPGAYCTVLLADLGADVLRVQPPAAAGRRATGAEGVALSRGKRSVTIDIRSAEGIAVLKRLAAAADVVVDNSLPGQMEERGFGYSQAAAELPALIWCSITGFGQDGPYSQRSGHDLTYTAHSGLLTALNPDLPWHPEAMLSVPLGAMMAATGIAAALVDRARTGKGCLIDVSLADSATWLLSGTDGELAGRHFAIPASAGRRLYRCSDDRWISVAAAEPRTWAALCNALELPELLEPVDPMGEDAKPVIDRLAAVFAQRPAHEWVDRLGPLGTAVGAVNQGADIVNDPHNRARGTTVEVAGVAVPANPIRMRDPDGPRSATSSLEPPEIGADTDSALVGAGFTPEEITALRASGVV